MWKNIKIIWIYRLGLILLLFLCLFVFLKLEPYWLPILKVVRAIVAPLLIAYLIAYLLHPLIERLHDRGLPRWLAIVAIYLLFFGGIGLGIYKGFPIILEQLEDINKNYPAFVRMYEDWVAGIQQKTEGMPYILHQKVDNLMIEMEGWLQGLVDTMVNTAKKGLNYSLFIVIIPFMVFYLLKDYNKVTALVWRMIPKKWQRESKEMSHEVNDIIGGYIRGQLFICLLLFIISTIAFWMIKLKYPLLLGLVIGVTDIIPYFGPIIGAVPAIAVAATESTSTVIWVAVIILVLQFLEGNILGPYIVGKSIQIHPVVIMLALIAGSEVGGVVGLILGVPCLAIIKVVYTYIRRVSRRKKEKIPN